MMRVVAIMRHAEPEGLGEDATTAAGRDRGLSALGRRQCEAARAWLDGLEPARVVASDSPRAIETARLVGAPLEPQVVPDLAGMRLGVWEEAPAPVMEDQLRRLIAGELPAPDGGETIEAFATRVRRGLRDALPAEGNALLVAHRLVNAVLFAEHLGLPLEQLLRVPQDRGGISILSLEDTRDQILTLNVTPLEPLRLGWSDVEDVQ